MITITVTLLWDYLNFSLFGSSPITNSMTHKQQTIAGHQKQQVLSKHNDSNNKKIVKDKTKKRCPLEYTNPLFKLSYSWLTPLILQGARKPLEMHDLYDIR